MARGRRGEAHPFARRLDPSARAGNLLRADLLRMACSEDLGRGARALIARRYPRDELRDFPGYEGGAVCPELSALATRVSNN